MAHYFDNEFSSEETYTIADTIAGEALMLSTWPGMFSFKKFDEGTRCLLQEVAKSPMCQNMTNASVLDLCAGYGLVGTYIKKKWPACNVRLVEINERACQFARHNFINVGGSGENVLCVDARDWFVTNNDSFDVILVNPPFSAGKQLCFDLLHKAFDALNVWWELWFVVPTKKGAKSYAAYSKEYLGATEQLSLHKWFRVYRVCK